MNAYIVSYDLVTPDKNYDDLVAYLKSHQKWWHHLASTWVIVTELSATELHDGIALHAGRLDKVFVVPAAGTGAWSGFTGAAQRWLTRAL